MFLAGRGYFNNMKLLFKVFYIVISFVLVGYMLLPSPEFPIPPADALQSIEPADSESELRKAYFVNLTREQVIAHYKDQFDSYPTLRLNYPPEEAQGIIRDQTRSTYLEELVHPFRESLYINGFEPALEKDAIVQNGESYAQKITVRYVPSSSFARVIYSGLTLCAFYVLVFRLKDFFISLFKWGINLLRK